MFRPVLSVSMIVRDEARRLPGCLDSLAGLADEIVIVDTGSTDDTVSVARAGGCTVHEYTWQNDFAAARNHALQFCAGDWVLSIDADERIAREDHDAIRAGIQGPRNRCFRFETRNYTDDPSFSGFTRVAPADPYGAGHMGWFPSTKIRLFPNLPGIAFEGAVHELLHQAAGSLGLAIESLAIPIHHYPMLHRSREERARKQALYLALGEAKVAARPDDPKGYHELGDQYVDMGDYARALASYLRAVELEPGNPLWLKDMGSALLLLGQVPQAIQALTLSVRLGPDDAECWRNLGVGHARASDWKSAKQAFERALALAPEHPETRRYLAMALDACGDRPGAIALLEQVLRQWPNHEAAREQLENLGFRI